MSEQIPEVEVNSNVQTEKPATEGFARTSTAAKLSGKFHGTAGFFKQKIGEMTENIEFEKTGRNQRFLGKIHTLVGVYREIQELAVKRAQNMRSDGTKILLKHGGKLVDQATEFLDDIKKTFL